ncbi:hypothetical protein Y032_0972g3256 [Ancylostoma ceylanicum]|uniref:Uncharacterized protein n=1 Tax=Ancylostoma ceylanicum TaxID=53326 RepID=A0A016W962_9BILA|nr:hypothetical protein Y032_0972g3256 [Ancylostoma ceylanicum]
MEDVWQGYQGDKWFPSRMLVTNHENKLRHHVTNEEVLRLSSTTSQNVIMAQPRLRLAGYIIRMPQQRIPHNVVSWIPPTGKRLRACPKNMWRRT